MASGEPGRIGLPALRHVEVGQEAGQETVTTQLQLMEAATVRDRAKTLKIVLRPTYVT